MVVMHIIAGLVALLAGAIALASRKGARMHRRAGSLFVLTMLVMSASGAALALFEQNALSTGAGLLAFYLVLTGHWTVRRPALTAAWVDAGLALAATGTGVFLLWNGTQAVAHEGGGAAAPFLVFGSVAIMAAALDAQMLLRRAPQGLHRIARHLWRLCFAMLMATTSFFLGQADVFPAPVRNFALLSLPVLAVLGSLLYWLGRLLLLRRRALPVAHA